MRIGCVYVRFIAQITLAICYNFAKKKFYCLQFKISLAVKETHVRKLADISLDSGDEDGEKER